jgi:hypothetical protein
MHTIHQIYSIILEHYPQESEEESSDSSDSDSTAELESGQSFWEIKVGRF